MMSLGSAIEWTDATWNPVRGCVKVSPGCKHCYAETFAERWRGIAGHPYEHGFDLRVVPEKLAEPLRWGQPKLVFVNSMSDLFQDGVEDAFIEATFDVMRRADWHVYQVLTKRADRLRDFATAHPALTSLPHVWLGVSVENKKYGLPRVQALREAPARTRFLSIEPLLEDLGDVNLDGVDWVIVGGESGPGARPMRREWVISLRDQCQTAAVPFFFKQWGGVQKSKAGRVLDGRTYDGMPPIVWKAAPTPATRRRMLGAVRLPVLHA